MATFRPSMSRRALLRGGLALGAGALLSACGDGSRSGTGTNTTTLDGDFSDAGIDWKQFSGTEITFGAMSHPWVDALQPHLQEFTELTGIRVKPQVLGEAQYVSKIAVTLAGGSPTPDVFLVYQVGQAVSSGWLEPLDAYLSDPQLTNPAWYAYADDVFPAARSFAQSDGTTHVMPITTEIQVVYTRDDLVPSGPTTFDELLAAARAANNGDTAGIGLRAVANPSEAPWPYAGFVFTEGGYLIDPQGRPALDSAPNVAALTFYAQLLREYGPRGVTGWGWLENNQAMSQGRLGMWSDTSTFLGGLRDATNSVIADKASAYPFPSKDSRSVPNFWFWTAGINAKSQQKKAAWLFLQWATSKPMAAAAGAAGTSPSRSSAWQDESIRQRLGTENVDRVLSSLQEADSEPMALAWKHAKWPEISDALARAVNGVVAGQSSPQAALQAAQRLAIAAVQ
ncbi:substrate-binding protein [Micromonospora qiuiae]|uniref:Substrate-binding protein n=1 Tax=Micromonospora qiuiae TaxID=502268 RepID=A0ABQ4JL80_9ACTN|nr:extracellular solute-binding protein [Micromonospora qiuiae]GIJ30312.1 substrate-binding protein [Micromonospora qiuiae]